MSVVVAGYVIPHRYLARVQERSYLVLDIETVPDLTVWSPPKAGSDNGNSRVFPPLYAHQVVVLGYMLLDARYRCLKLDVLSQTTGREQNLLQAFSTLVKDKGAALVTYNGRSFDLPVLALRSLHCGVPMPWYYTERGQDERYNEDAHLDLCDWLANHGASRACSLDAMARLIGLPGKIGMDGSEVAGLYRAGEIERIRNYCLADVAQTALLFLRFRLLQGVFDRSQYRVVVEQLTHELKEDRRLNEMTCAIDAQRLLSAA